MHTKDKEQMGNTWGSRRPESIVFSLFLNSSNDYWPIKYGMAWEWHHACGFIYMYCYYLFFCSSFYFYFHFIGCHALRESVVYAHKYHSQCSYSVDILRLQTAPPMLLRSTTATIVYTQLYWGYRHLPDSSDRLREPTSPPGVWLE